jgi:uncharacterized protein (DUF2141 family)
MARAALLAIAIVAAASPCQVWADEPVTSTIAVQVTGVKDTSGKVCVAVYDDAGSFPDAGKHYRFACGAIQDAKSFLVFKDVPQGTYAAFAFHDADANGKLKQNFIGMPVEGVGASRGAKGLMGPPSFEDAKFQVRAERKVVRIRLTYL